MSNLFHAGFTAGQPPVRVRFGPGARHDLAQDLDALGIRRPLILTTPEQAGLGAALADQLTDQLAGHVAGHFAKAQMHTPVEVTDQAMTQITETKADGILAIGGGSTIGLGKAIAYRTGLPQIVLPTTYAGSEATSVLGQTEKGVKTTLRAASVQPKAILYDPELVATLPVAMTVTSGLNAMAHAVEALYAPDATPLSSALAMDGLRAFVTGLPAVVQNPGDLTARQDTLFGAWLCGTVLNQVGMALHHKLCHTLGGGLNLPHAETHAIILPHATAYNDTGQLQPLADLMGGETAGQALFDFAHALGAPQALQDLGVLETDLDRMADLGSQTPYPNPREITRDGIRQLLQDAFEGRPPTNNRPNE